MSTENIDWSKAPEGATRYHPETSKVIEHWLKLVGDEEWIWTSVGKRWMPNIVAVEDGEYHERPSYEWTGKGLPPADIKCEVFEGDGYINWTEDKTYLLGQRVTVRASFVNDCDQNISAIELDDGKCVCILSKLLRPIRTPEQIAAEKADAAIFELGQLMISNRRISNEHAIARILYEAGYRKVEGGDV